MRNTPNHPVAIARRPAAAAALLLLMLPLTGCHVLYDSLGGAWKYEPHQMPGRLSPEAQDLIDQAFADIGDDEVPVDMHAHMISSDVNREWISGWHPFQFGRTMVYLSGAGVELTSPTIEQDYVDRILAQLEQFSRPMRLYLYALDRAYYPDGSIDFENTNIYISNHTVYELSQRYPHAFKPVVSIHPFRDDAIAKLKYWADRGVRHVKWLPNSMGINPASPSLDPFYDVMAERDMVLLSHTGDEGALNYVSEELGNPLLLRRPLDRGVKVVALHFASDGVFKDFENPRHLKREPGYKLLLRMLDDPSYDDLLYIDTASMIFFNHLEEPLMALLERPDLHGRFINGSDYPLSALNVTIWTSILECDGFIEPEHVKPLNEIYDYNPMLFEFVAKRTIRHPETGQRLGRDMFFADESLR